MVALKAKLSKEHTWKATFVVPVAVGITSGIAVEIWKGFPVSRLAGRGFAWIWCLATDHISLPVWLFAIIATFASGFLVALGIRFLRTHSEPDWTQYTHDTFLDVVWHWDYHSGKVASSRLFPICPKCSYEMKAGPAGAYYQSRTTLHCEDCGYTHEIEGSVQDLPERVVKLINRMLRTGEYRKRLQEGGSLL